jgi:hypothetical protein
LRTRLPTTHVSQPTAAFLRLKTPTCPPYPARHGRQTKEGPARFGAGEALGELPGTCGRARLPAGRGHVQLVEMPHGRKSCATCAALRKTYVWCLDRERHARRGRWKRGAHRREGDGRRVGEWRQHVVLRDGHHGLRDWDRRRDDRRWRQGRFARLWRIRQRGRRRGCGGRRGGRGV